MMAFAVLAAAGPLGCGITGPGPQPHGDNAGAQEAGGAKPPNPGPTHLVLRLGERRLYVMDDDPGTPTESFPIAIGKEGWETPTGQFHVEEMVEHPDFLKFDTTVVPPRSSSGFRRGRRIRSASAGSGSRTARDGRSESMERRTRSFSGAP